MASETASIDDSRTFCCISHPAFNRFWVSSIAPKTTVRTSHFISLLLIHIAEMIYRVDIRVGNDSAVEDKKAKYEQIKMRMASERKVLQLFGGKGKEFEDRMLTCLDFDGVGALTAMKLDRAARSIPYSASLFEAVFILFHQQSINILPPFDCIREQEYLQAVRVAITTALSCIEAASADASEPQSLDSLDNLGKGVSNSMPIVGIEYSFVDRTIASPIIETLYGYFGSLGWHLVGGQCCIGKTTTVLAVLRQFLLDSRSESSPRLHSSVDIAVSVSEMILDPLRVAAASSLRLGLDTLYLDLRCCQSASEVMAATASQWCLRGDSIGELEIQLKKTLKKLRNGSVLVFDHVSSAQCSAVLAQLLDDFAKTLSIVIVTAGAMSVNSQDLPSQSSPRGSRPNSKFNFPFSPASTASNGLISPTASKKKFFPVEVAPSVESPRSTTDNMDDVFVDVMEGLGGTNRLEINPFKSCALYFPSLESIQLQLLARWTLQESSLLGLSVAENHQSRNIETLVRLSGGDPCILQLLCRIPNAAFLLVEDYARSRGLFEPTGSPGGLSADEIFLHSGSDLFEDLDCLAIIACFTPCINLAGVVIDIEHAWSLSQHVFLALYATHSNFGNTKSARKRFNSAWAKLNHAGWLVCCCNVQSLAGSRENRFLSLTLSAAAVQSTRLYDHAATRVLDSCRAIKSREELMSISWDSYYNYWVKQLHLLNREFLARGQTINISARSAEGSVESGYINVNIVRDNTFYTSLLMRELVDVVDRNIWHYFRLFSLWFKSHSSRDFLAMSAMSVASARFNSKSRVFESERRDIVSMKPDLGVLSSDNIAKRGQSIESDLDEKTLEFLPELRSNFPLGKSSELSSDLQPSLDLTDTSKTRGRVAKISGKMSATGDISSKFAVLRQKMNDVAASSTGDDLNTAPTRDVSNRGTASKPSISLSGPISDVLRESANPKLNSVFTQFHPGSPKEIGLLGLMTRSDSSDGYFDGATVEIAGSHPLRRQERERKRLLREYITADPAEVAEALAERKITRSLGERAGSGDKYTPSQAPESVSSNVSSGLPSKFRKPTSLQELLIPLAQTMGIVLSRRMPVFRSVEIMRHVVEKLPRTVALVRATLELGEFMSIEAEDDVPANSAERCFVEAIELADELSQDGTARSESEQLELQYLSLYGSFCLARVLIRNDYDDAGFQLLEQVVFRLRAIVNTRVGIFVADPSSPTTTDINLPLVHHLIDQLLPDAIVLQALTLSKNPDVQVALGGLQSELDLLHHSSQLHPDSAASSPRQLAATPVLATSSDDIFSNYGSDRGRIPSVISGDKCSSPSSRFGSPRKLDAAQNSKIDRARLLYEDSERMYRRLYGENSVRAAEMHTAIGDMLRLLGRLDGARSHYEAALAVYKRRFEGPSARVGFALVGLADAIYRETKRESLARRLLEEAFIIFQAIYSDEDLSVRATAHALAQLLTAQMRYDRAIVLYEQSLMAARRAMQLAKGPSSKERENMAIPPLLVTIASLHYKTGHHQLAIPLFQEAITTYRDIYGYEHQTVADTMCLLAAAQGRVRSNDTPSIESKEVGLDAGNNDQIMEDEGSNVENYTEAVHTLRDALRIYKTIDKEDSVVYIRALRQLARLHEKNGKYEEAKDCFEGIIRAYVNMHIGLCEEVGDTYIAFGRVLCANEEQGEAITLYNQALTVFCQLFGDLHYKVAETLYALGSAHIEINSHEEAQPFFERAIVLWTEIAPECSQIGDCYNSIGCICQELDEYEEARDYYRKALTIYIRCFGKFHASVANVVNNMATIFDDLDEHEAAAHFYEQSISIMKQVHGHRSLLLLPSLENLASLMEDQGIYETAAELRKEAEDVAAGPPPRSEVPPLSSGEDGDNSPKSSPSSRGGSFSPERPNSASTESEISPRAPEFLTANSGGTDTSTAGEESSSGSACVVM